jgi:hypothetical protein
VETSLKSQAAVPLKVIPLHAKLAAEFELITLQISRLLALYTGSVSPQMNDSREELKSHISFQAETRHVTRDDVNPKIT